MLKDLQPIEASYGAPVDVYFNLTSHLWSVRSRRTGRVVAHSSNVLVADASFVVNKAGNNQVRRTGHKNVHAFVRGILTKDVGLSGKSWHPVIYNPYKHKSFVSKISGHAVIGADYVRLRRDNTVGAAGLDW